MFSFYTENVFRHFLKESIEFREGEKNRAVSSDELPIPKPGTMNGSDLMTSHREVVAGQRCEREPVPVLPYSALKKKKSGARILKLILKQSGDQ